LNRLYFIYMISVVVCAKNEENYIGNCLQCLKKQTLKPEIIVVEGHSTDKTYNIAKKYADKVVRDKKRGIAAARNLGWKTAKGDIVAYCDADSLPPKDWVEKISKFMKELNQPSIEYSLLIFHPQHLMRDLPITPLAQAQRCYDAAKEHLEKVNVGNLGLLGGRLCL